LPQQPAWGAVTVAETEIPSPGATGLLEESHIRTEIEARRGRAANPGSEPGGNGSDEIGKENAALRRLVVAYQHLSSLAAQDADLQTVTELIAESVGTAVAVVDQRLVVTAACNTAVPEETWLCGQPLTHPGIAQIVEAVSRTRRAVRIPDVAGTGAIIVAPVPVGDEVAAFLLALDIGEQGDGRSCGCCSPSMRP
jgi:hypothetical protein